MSPPTEVAGRYAIERRLGAGGMSTVFMAHGHRARAAGGGEAARRAPRRRRGLRVRASGARRSRPRSLQHPNIVQVFDSGQDPASQRHYIVMEYVDGPSARRPAARAQAARHRRDRAARARRLPRARLRPPRRRRAPRREARQPAVRRGDGHHQARRLRHREGGRADAASRRSARCSARPPTCHPSRRAARRPARHRTSTRSASCAYQFLTGRLPHEYTSLTELALKQQQDPVRPDRATTARRSRRSSTTRSGWRSSATRPRATDSALEMAEAIEAGARGEATAATQRLAMTDYDATRAMDAPPPRRRCRAPSTRGRRPRACTTWHRRWWLPPPAAAATSAPSATPRGGRTAGAGSAAFLALLAAIAAIVVVALALLSSSGGNSVQPVDTGRRSAADRPAARLHPRALPLASSLLGLVGVGPVRDRVAQAAHQPLHEGEVVERDQALGGQLVRPRPGSAGSRACARGRPGRGSRSSIGSRLRPVGALGEVEPPAASPGRGRARSRGAPGAWASRSRTCRCPRRPRARGRRRRRSRAGAAAARRAGRRSAQPTTSRICSLSWPSEPPMAIAVDAGAARRTRSTRARRSS